MQDKDIATVTKINKKNTILLLIIIPPYKKIKKIFHKSEIFNYLRLIYPNPNIPPKIKTAAIAKIIVLALISLVAGFSVIS